MWQPVSLIVIVLFFGGTIVNRDVDVLEEVGQMAEQESLIKVTQPRLLLQGYSIFTM